MSDDTLGLCRNQVLGFFRDLDDNDYASLVRRMTPDGVWHRQGKVLEGREAVLSALATRSPTMRIHHLICNLFADRADAAHCAMRAYMLVVRHDAGRALAGPAPLTGIENIRTTHIELARADGGWLIAQMRNDEPSFAAVPG
ncbi:hypothetical protein CAL14_00045 [Bordetella genomosp. 9]|uniref:nuclear transport factor 2 family protein n=1 Tax=Bordetella genomosp. 9 TaxID=1416803 RepID=UPI000A296682|nr:nuclear transport factor 2 family protein [Bordetella genomosp. 9]ARP88886.1 hypothetical protein CAL14_00045 [Bordetella genomosp. 9]